MKFLTVAVLALATVASVGTAFAGDNVDDCHSISDSVHGIWGCR